MTDAPNPATTIYLPPTETVRVWEERSALRPTVNWSEMINEDHAASFTVAKIAELDLLTAMRSSLDEVIRNGGTFEEWKASIMPTLQRHGWWGEVTNKALTGTDQTIIVNDARLRTIYRTNIRMSIAAGRWRRFQREKDLFPYLRYLSNHYRKHPRLDHQSWHGLILPIDDPTWQWMFPPNGWGCHCKVEQVSEARMHRNGWKVGTPPARDTVPFETASGRIVEVQRGVEPGFSYNPGTAHLQVIADRAIASMSTALDAGNGIAADRILREIVADPAFEQFIALPTERFPVAIMSTAEQQMMSAKSQLVVLSEGTYGKQLIRHPDLTIDDYRVLPDAVREADIILQQGEFKLIFCSERRAPDRIWKAVIRQDDREPFPLVVSFQRASLKEAARELQKPETSIILDRDHVL